MTAIPHEFAQALRELGLAGDHPLRGEPLTGGVSSDIWRIDLPGGAVCAKRALTKLRVAADWFAPITRNRYEAEWMQVAQAAAPGSVPRVLGQHEALGVLVMAYLPETEHPLWKSQLRDGHADPRSAQAVGHTLARIHSFSAARPDLASRFDSDMIFFDIRLEPYLLATATRHPDLAPILQRLVEQTQGNPRALVHGDVSPKNILIAVDRPIFLDAECAWWGDPAFDIAFCLNHLLLKCLWNRPASDRFLACFDAVAKAWLEGVDWEPRQAAEQRAAALLPGLLLARVDGKSPVEYITDDGQREVVRRAAIALLRTPVQHLADIRAAWREEINRP